ncbi:hypothetical protein FF1_003561 [Malus domestica]
MGNHCLSLAFKWQLYTIWLLVQHKSDFGTRCSIYIDLAMTAFGQKLSAGTCVQLIIIGGGTVKLFIKTVCNDGVNCDAKSLTNVECFLLLMCMAIVPNLNYIAWVSLIGATTAIACCTLIWAGRPGHNVILEMQIPYTNGAMLKAISGFHGHNTSQHVLGLIYIVIIISCLTTYQIYGMVAFDIMNINSIYIPGIPITSHWRKPRLTNMALGCSGLLLSLLFVAAAAWSLNANFFKPS